MITTPQEYFGNLDILSSINRPPYALLPSAENVYNIDINTRTVEVPDFLGVEKEHNAEVIYFSIDRYADYMDLAQTSCIVTYTNANKKTRYYAVPFFDIFTKANENKMLFPWCLSADVNEKAGSVEFAISFFTIGQDKGKVVLDYQLNTLPVKSKVLSSIKEHLEESDPYFLEADQYRELDSRINALEQDVVVAKLYWTIVPESNSPNQESEAAQEDSKQDLSEVLQNLEDEETTFPDWKAEEPVG